MGNTTGKNALEKGSSKSVGSSSAVAPRSHSDSGSPAPAHKRRTSHAISGNVTANRISVPFQSPGRKRCCPSEAQSERSAQPNNEAASNQPAIQNRIHNMNMSSYSYISGRNASPKSVRPLDVPVPLRRSTTAPGPLPCSRRFSVLTLNCRPASIRIRSKPNRLGESVVSSRTVRSASFIAPFLCGHSSLSGRSNNR